MTYHKGLGAERARITCDRTVRHDRVPPQGEDLVSTVAVMCGAVVDRWPTDEKLRRLDRSYTADDLRGMARQLGWKVRHKTTTGYEDLCPEHKPARKPNPTPYGRRLA